MGTTYRLRVVRVGGDGALVDVDGDDARFSVKGSVLFAIVDGVVSGKYRGAWKRSPYRWFYDAYDYESGAPTVKHCHRPTEVLEGVQDLEREISRNVKKYPAEWVFWFPPSVERPCPAAVRTGDGPWFVYRMDAYYKRRHCRLFSDEQGCWARELEAGPRQGAHHELTGERQVDVQLERDGAHVLVTLERRPFVVEYPDVMAGLRAVCKRAQAEGALLLPSHG